MRNDLISPVRGMHDVLPDQADGWQRVETLTATCFRCYGYREIRTPIVERLALFSRQLGEDTDVVQKEMYSFVDSLNGDQIVLRPEATVSTMRALLSGGMHRSGVSRVWYGGPMFRHERPQKGRYRQFHQLGAEAVGSDEPAIEIEQILLLARLWRQLGIADRLTLDINNLGNYEERQRHREKLINYFRRHEQALDDQSRQRWQTNPLRVLDSKHPQTMAIVAEAPVLADDLGEASRRHVDTVKENLSAAGIVFNECATLVRGLDYYNLTVFEWTVAADNHRQNAICGGGRYDGLAEKIGGHALPGCGFAFGVERVLDLMEDVPAVPVDCYLAITDNDCAALADSVAEKCRDDGLSVWRHIGGGNLSKQIKKADTLQTPMMLIIGPDENAGGYITLKRLSDGKQKQTGPQNVALEVRRLINNA